MAVCGLFYFNLILKISNEEIYIINFIAPQSFITFLIFCLGEMGLLNDLYLSLFFMTIHENVCVCILFGIIENVFIDRFYEFIYGAD